MRRMVWCLCLVLIFTIPWENIVEFPGLGRVSRLAGLAVAAVWMAKVAWTGWVRKPRAFHVMVFLFLEWNALSYFWTVDPAATVERLFTYVQLFILVCILWDTVTTLESIHLALQAYVLGAWVTVVSLIGNYVIRGGTEYQDRFTAGTFQLDDVSLILSLGVPAAWYLTVHRRTGVLRALRWVNFLYVPPAVIAIMLTGSRTAFVSLAAGLAYMLASLARLRRPVRVTALVGLVGLVLVMAPLVPSQTVERLRATGREATEGTFSGRTFVWREAYDMFSHHPVLGVGSGAFRGADSRHVPHNFVLGFLVETGLVGFLLFASILLLAAAGAVGQPAGLSGLWGSVLMTWLIGASFYNFGEKKQTWLFFSLVLAGAGLVERRRHLGGDEPAADRAGAS
jgi:exopolysaccharide production protein ExoQ